MNSINVTWTLGQLESLDIKMPNSFAGRYSLEDGVNPDILKHFGNCGVYRELPNFFDLESISKEFSNLVNKSFAIHKMSPGMLLPLHKDNYKHYSEVNNIQDLNTIVRIIVFLQDFKLGHILQVEDTPISSYKAGDYIQWVGQTPHVAGNLGTVDRYTLQITGTKI